jgi:rhodanese-related sulfurtransferase
LQRAADLYAQGAMFVDARDPGDYKKSHIRRAVSLSPMEREHLYPLLKPGFQAAKQIVVYGKSFSQYPAAEIGQFLRQQGFQNVWVMDVCLADWQGAGHAVRKPKRPRSGKTGAGS